MTDARKQTLATRCGVCGEPSHRYGTGDPKHKFDAIACVNSLLHKWAEVEETARDWRYSAEFVGMMVRRLTGVDRP